MDNEDMLRAKCAALNAECERLRALVAAEQSSQEMSATLAALSAENVVLSTTLDRIDEALHTMGQGEGLAVLRAKATLARRILKETAPIRQKSHIRTT